MRTIFVTGKGGVGKTLVAVALGRALAESGRRTRIVEVGNGGGLAERLGVELDEGPVAVGDRLSADRYRYESSIDHYLRHALPRPAHEVLKRNRAFGLLAMAAPQVKELAVATELVRLDDIDACVVDLPASGHARAILSAPETFLRMVPSGPLHGAALEIRRLFAGATALVVTRPEPTPVAEAIETSDALAGYVGRVGWILNEDLPRPLTAAELARVPDDARAAFEIETSRARRAAAARRRLTGRPTWSIPSAIDPLSAMTPIAEEVIKWSD